MSSVLQDWVHNLTFMQQSVLITACRGPDGLHKDHVAKVLCRWMRRCFLKSALDGGKVFSDPYEKGGGSFTGPCPQKFETIDEALTEYLKSCDEVPHHFHLHLMHASEILGYKHPDQAVRDWWNEAYVRMAMDMHVLPETVGVMDFRLGDSEANWRAFETAPAAV